MPADAPKQTAIASAARIDHYTTPARLLTGRPTTESLT